MTWRGVFWIALTAGVLVGFAIYLVWVALRRRASPSEAARSQLVTPLPPCEPTHELEPVVVTAPPPPPPLVQTFDAGDCQVTIDAVGLVARVRGMGYATSWRTYCEVPWLDVTSLHIDSALHDGAVSLFAVLRTE